MGITPINLTRKLVKGFILFSFLSELDSFSLAYLGFSPLYKNRVKNATFIISYIMKRKSQVLSGCLLEYLMITKINYIGGDSDLGPVVKMAKNIC